MKDRTAAERPRPTPTWITVDAPEASPSMEAFVREVDPFGVILFARHLREASQVRELTECIGGASAFAPLLALDQEGGRVSRLAALGHRFPGASELGGVPEVVRAVAAEMGGLLKDLGFEVDFAPVADLGPAVPGTGLEGRLYADDADTVTACCAAFLDGLREAGVEGCLKHFPGLGGSAVDSHRDLPWIPGAAAERDPHICPYRGLAHLTPFVMTAHGAYESLGNGSPSSLHPETYQLLARTGFAGTAVTDDLKMGAVASLGLLGGLAERALRAGAHVALWASPQEETLRAVEHLRSIPELLEKGAEIPYLLLGGRGAKP